MNKLVEYTSLEIGGIIKWPGRNEEIICKSEDFSNSKYLQTVNIEDGIETHRDYLFNKKNSLIKKTFEKEYDNYAGEGKIIQN